MILDVALVKQLSLLMYMCLFCQFLRDPDLVNLYFPILRVIFPEVHAHVYLMCA